jgi:hypothetical protein
MKRSSGPRKTANLSRSLYKRLNMYAIAASAAGVEVLALGQPAEARIVYTTTWVEISPHARIAQLDVNNDGIADFKFSDYATAQSRESVLKVRPSSQKNAVWGAGGYASALPAGVRVGPKGKFQPGTLVMAGQAGTCEPSCTFHSFGPWVDVTRRYLGLKFSIHGEIHYGWARLNVSASSGIHAALTVYAYETIANKPIITGQLKGVGDADHGDPSIFDVTDAASPGLGALALGVQGMDIWRKRDQ